MTIAAILNTKLFFILLSLSFGGLVSSTIPRKWQQRKAGFDLRLSIYKEILENYHILVSMLNLEDKIDEFERRKIHGKLLAINKLSKVIFDDKSIFEDWKFVIQNISNLAALTDQKRTWAQAAKMGLPSPVPPFCYFKDSICPVCSAV